MEVSDKTESAQLSAELSFIMRLPSEDLYNLHTRLLSLVEAVEARAHECDLLDVHDQSQET